jgi:predicted porin
MKRFFFLLSLSATTFFCNAQSRVGTFSFIPKIGVCLSNMTENDFKIGENTYCSPKYKAGFTGGVEAEYQVTSPLSVSLAALYTMEGCRYRDESGMVTSSPVSYKGYADHTINLQVLNIPLTVNYYVAEGFAVKAGVQMGFAMDTNEKYEVTPFTIDKVGQHTYGTMEKHNENTNKLYKKVDMSIPLGVSYEYMNVVVDARYNIGITKNNKVNDSKSNFFALTVGYKFDM